MMAVEQSLFDALYCEEEQEESSGVTFSFFDGGAVSDDDGGGGGGGGGGDGALLLLPLLKQDLMWDDEELQTLFSKQEESFAGETAAVSGGDLPRKEAVEWVLRINSHYGFSASTAILAVSYLDRFLSGRSFQKEKPWMVQLAAVACLSLAAKVEETYVPLLLDLQVEGATKYAFEAKTIQRMELLILSSLKWRMNSVTPLSFIDHGMRRLGLKNSNDDNLNWEFLRRCENLLLIIISDSRFRRYSPSVLAGATMIYASGNGGAAVDECQVISMLRISIEEVKQCCNFLSETSAKRRETDDSSSAVSSDSPSPEAIRRRNFKRPRVQEQQMRLRLFAIGSPH